MRRRSTRALVEQTHQIVDRIQMALITRETNMAIEAYDGLRKAVTGAQSQRHAHIADLARLHRAMLGGADTTSIRSHLDEMLDAVGVRPLADPALLPSNVPIEFFFEVLGGDGDAWEVIAPAYADTNWAVAARGRIRAVPSKPAGQLPTDASRAEGEPTAAAVSATHPSDPISDASDEEKH